jgi:hypothetical protein
LIQPLARPINKVIEVPVLEMAVKSKKVPVAANKKPEPVQMMAQTPFIDKNAIVKQPVAKD